MYFPLSLAIKFVLKSYIMDALEALFKVKEVVNLKISLTILQNPPIPYKKV